MGLADSSDIFTARLIEHLKNNLTPGQAMEAILPYLGQQLRCDRVFLYLRHPDSGLGRVPFCWRRSDEIPVVYDPQWKPEPEDLGSEDPMFAAALALQPSLFIDDVETADPQTLNREFEAENFGHRALVHAHLGLDRQLWGVLQPCTFGRPHPWTAADRQLIHRAVAWFTPLTIDYVLQHHPQYDRQSAA